MEIQQVRKHIVVVDDNPVNLDLAETVLREEFKVTKLISGEQLLKFLNRVRPDMILLDIQMPGISGFDVLREIRKNPQFENIPVIFLSGQKEPASEREGFQIGAQDFIGKPFDNEVMLSRIRSQMELYQYREYLEQTVKEKTKLVEELHNTITEIWAEMVESRDGTTGAHVRNTTNYFKMFMDILSNIPEYKDFLAEETVSDLSWASMVHDIGKIGISDNVLKKPGPLTLGEMEDMRRHSEIGADIILKIINSTVTGDKFLGYAREMALWHHECWDGTGYPQGLKENEIPPYVQILSIVDVYDALTSERPYKRAFTHEEALDIIQCERGKFFSPVLVDIFMEHGEEFRAVLEAGKEKAEAYKTEL